MKDGRYDLVHVSLRMNIAQSIGHTQVNFKLISRHREVGAQFLPWKATWMMIVLRLGLVHLRLEVGGRRRRECYFARGVSWWCGSCIWI